MPESSLTRLRVYKGFATRSYFHPDIVNTIVSTFKVYNNKTMESMIYAILYTNITKDKNIRNDICLVGPSWISKDGEYRAHILLKNDIPRIIRDYDNLIDKVQTLYLKSNIVFKYDETFFPTDGHKIVEEKLIKNIYSENWAGKFFLYAWMKYMKCYTMKMFDSHINPSYKILFEQNMRKNIKLYEEYIQIIKKNKFPYLDTTINNINHFRERDNKKYATTTLTIGQKTISLNLAEVQNPFNIQYKPWKEYIIGRFLTRLLTSGIASCFPIVCGWMYVKNIKKGLFDNKIHYDKLEKSTIAKEIASKLVQSQIFTHQYINPSKEISEKIMTTWLSDKFKILDDKITGAIDYTKDELIMSDVALCIFSEYVGTCISDVLDNQVGIFHKMLTDNEEVFIKYLFDICFGLYLLHTKYGIIHGDLHINNVTISNDTEVFFKTKVEYTANQLCYMFDTNGTGAYIIDFGRSQINYKMLKMYNIEEYHTRFPLIKNSTDYIKDQINYLVNLLIISIEDYAPMRMELISLFKKNYETCFKFFTALDIYEFVVKLSTYIKLKKYPVSERIINIFDIMKKKSLQVLALTLGKILTNPELIEEYRSSSYIITEVIVECFGEYIRKPITLEEIDTEQNIYYDIQGKAKKLGKDLYGDIITFRKIHPFTEQFMREENVIPIVEYDTRSKKNLDMIDFIAKRHIEKYF